MTIPFIGNPLIGELLADPVTFNNQGRAYQLLQEYFGGYPIETLRPLLAHDDELVKRAAIWILSELGEKGCALFDSVVPLTNSEIRYIRYHALEISSVCAIGNHADQFVCIARALQSEDEVIRVLAMRLIGNADLLQVEAGAKSQVWLDQSNDNVTHQRGLANLALNRSLSHADVLQMMNAKDPLMRRYGAIAARRLADVFPALVLTASESADPDVMRFAKEYLERKN